MKKEIKDRWIKALRSGKYKQCQTKLRSFDRKYYCCLGVLTQICATSKKRSFLEFAGWNDTLSKEVADWAGIECSSQTTKVPLPIINKTLVHFNDTKQYTFNQIADLIEKYL